MNILFYIASFLAIWATLMMIINKNAVHALLYLIASLLAVSVIFFILGAPFAAALEVIIYAGAIMVLFVFVIMMLNVSGAEQKMERELLKPKAWIGPSVISAILLGELVYMLASQSVHPTVMQEVPPAAVGKLMFSKYILVVDLAAFLLMAGIIGAYHLGQKEKRNHHRYLKNENQNL
jgi:NADH-quinone oxidoreductase subunit J